MVCPKRLTAGAVALIAVAIVLYVADVRPVRLTQHEPLRVTNVKTASGSRYEVADSGFAWHVLPYIDREYRYSALPVELTGATLIRTANADAASRGDRFLTFDVNRPVTVYVAHDERMELKPEWLGRFERTNLVLASDDIRSRGAGLFKKHFAAGSVTLGGNAGTQQAAYSMYSVIIVPRGAKNLPPVVDIGPDRRVYLPDRSIHLFAGTHDDAKPHSRLSCTWSCVSGPDDVTFSDINSATTRATFGTTGEYSLVLSLTDGRHTVSDTVRVELAARPEPFTFARRNAEQAREGFIRCKRFLDAWLMRRDASTGLIRSELDGQNVWEVKDSAADCYPFMVLSAEVTAPSLFEGACLDMLRSERELTSRIDSLPDNWNLDSGRFVHNEPDMARIQFGASEYVKDGLIAITEWIGQSPWTERMVELVDDCWEHATIETPFGPIVSENIENNGEMLQILPRLYWMTGRDKYLEWAIRLGDYYLLGSNHPTRDMKELRLRDHGCEVVSGLCELYATCRFARPEKYAQYRAALYEMLDRILDVGATPDGMFHDIIDPQSGRVTWARAGDNFGYNLNGYYTVYLLDGHEAYRQAALKPLLAIHRYPGFHGGEPMDGHCDAIEGVLYLLNREPLPCIAAWIDESIRTLWEFQRDDGTIGGTYLDGNFARTTLLYCLWKTQGATLRPWRDDVALGATREGDTLEIYVRAESAWQGRIRFDRPRHREHLKLPMDWPRINQFSPEWTTISREGIYIIEDVDNGTRVTYSKDTLRDGLPVTLAAGEERRFRMICDSTGARAVAGSVPGR